MERFKLFINSFIQKTNAIDFSRLLFLLSISLFVLTSLTKLYNHIPWADEVNAWNIAAYVDFFDLFKLMKHEGHLFIWFTILMPFAKNNLFYPQYMLLINWLFMFLSVILMWRFAPFNSVIKTFLTFSMPFVVNAYLARCYSIGILFLFGIASLYSNRFKHPFIYSFLIILAANTSVMAIIGAFAFGVLFLYDLYKCKKIGSISNRTIFSIVLIFLFGALLVFVQLYDFNIPYYAINSSWCNYGAFLNFYLGNGIIKWHSLPLVLSYSILLIFSTVFFKNSKNISLFLLFTQAALLFVFAKIYGGSVWHFSFFFIYFIISVWIFCSENSLKTKFQKFYMFIFLIFSFCLINYNLSYKYYNGACSYFRDYVIENRSEFQNIKIFVFPNHCYINTIFPYIEKYKLQIYNSQADSLRSLDFFLHQWDNGDINFDAIAKELGDDDYGFLLTLDSSKFLYSKEIKLKAKKSNLELLPYNCVIPVYIHKIIKINKFKD